MTVNLAVVDTPAIIIDRKINKLAAVAEGRMLTEARPVVLLESVSEIQRTCLDNQRERGHETRKGKETEWEASRVNVRLEMAHVPIS